MPDGKLARMAGVSKETVFMERHRRGIAASQPHARHAWTAESIALLGTASDGEVGAALGISGSAVYHQRRLRGIAPFTEAPYLREPEFRWTAEDVALLGTMSDGELAASLQISAGTVSRERRRLRIPAYRFKSPDVEWTAEMLELLGRVPDAEVARRHGIPVKAVKGKRRQLDIPCPVEWGAYLPTDELRRLLALPSSEVRRRAGLHSTTILRLRDKLGIETLPLWRPWQPAEIALLGTAPDDEVATRLGRSVGGVRRKRWKLHIPAAAASKSQGRQRRPG
jgi:hypothetical protein